MDDSCPGHEACIVWPMMDAQRDSVLRSFLIAWPMFCQLVPSPDERFITAAEVRTNQRWLISIFVANHRN